MSDLFGNQIVGFPTRRLIYFQLFCIIFSDSFQLHQNKQAQVKNPSQPADLNIEPNLVCRQESKASSGSGNGTANLLQSLSSNLESLKVMEDSKSTNKK